MQLKFDIKDPLRFVGTTFWKHALFILAVGILTVTSMQIFLYGMDIILPWGISTLALSIQTQIWLRRIIFFVGVPIVFGILELIYGSFVLDWYANRNYTVPEYLRNSSWQQVGILLGNVCKAYIPFTLLLLCMLSPHICMVLWRMMVSPHPANLFVIVILCILLTLPFIFHRFILFKFLVMDKKMGVMDSLRSSYRATENHSWPILWSLFILIFLLFGMNEAAAATGSLYLVVFAWYLHLFAFTLALAYMYCRLVLPS
jgi:hypothetical protein